MNNEIRNQFPNLSYRPHGKDLIYFDNAATTLKPQRVIDRIVQHYTNETANVHRGVYDMSERATASYEGVRDQVKEFINAQDRKEIIFTSGTTDSINLVVQSYGHSFIGEGDEIIVSEMEHHSNIVPWQMLCMKKGCRLRVIPMNDRGELIFEEFERLVNHKTKMIAVGYVSNALGTINPIEKISSVARQKNICFLVDAAQAMTAKKIDVQKVACDFLCFSAHKMYGPTGVGVLYGREGLLKKMPPYRGGGDMIASVSFEKTTYNELPYKFEAGTPNIADVIGFGEALNFISSIGQSIIDEHQQGLVDYATRQLGEMPQIKIIGTAEEKSAVISFVIENIHPHDVGTLLDQEGIAVRTGHHCAEPVMKHFGVPATVRASFAVYNTKAEVDAFIRGLKKVVEMFR